MNHHLSLKLLSRLFNHNMIITWKSGIQVLKQVVHYCPWFDKRRLHFIIRTSWLERSETLIVLGAKSEDFKIRTRLKTFTILSWEVETTRCILLSTNKTARRKLLVDVQVNMHLGMGGHGQKFQYSPGILQ